MVYINSANSFSTILWLQWISAMGAMITLFTCGLMLGWTSPYMAKLTADDSPLPLTTDEASWVVSLVNFGRLIGAIIGGISVQYFGSKQTLVFIGFPLMFGWICIIVANSVIWLYAARMSVGLSMGMVFCSFPLFLGEVSNPRIRGSLVSLAMTGMALGTVAGNTMGAYLPMTLFASISLGPNIAFILLLLWIPQSPHYLVRVGRIEDAKKSIARFDPTVDPKVEVESLKDFMSTSDSLSFRDRLREFNIPQNRKAGFITLVLYFFMQFSGLNTVIFYMEIILSTSKLDVISPATGVIIVGASGVVSGWISVYIADKFRRKVLMALSSTGVCISMILLATYFTLLKNNSDFYILQWCPLISIFLFQIAVANGIIAVPNMILSELFAPNIKSMAACFASIFIGLFSFTAAKCYQPLVDVVGEAWVFWIHAILMALSAIFAVTFLPETKGKSLQEIQDALGRK